MLSEMSGIYLIVMLGCLKESRLNYISGFPSNLAQQEQSISAFKVNCIMHLSYARNSSANGANSSLSNLLEPFVCR